MITVDGSEHMGGRGEQNVRKMEGLIRAEVGLGSFVAERRPERTERSAEQGEA
jgi:hypothetical protein